MDSLKQAYLNLSIGHGNDRDKIWVKKLKNILLSDIHSKPLGCKVDDTHIKIGDVHLETFFEAQILFSHNYWVSRFADWLTERVLSSASETNKKRVVLIGYETYVEPVLYKVERNICAKEKSGVGDVKYLIFEEKKYIQTDKTTQKSRLRYIDEVIDYKRNDTLFVFICGISSTLTTFNKMIEGLFSHIKKNKIEINFQRKEYSIIQVLPSNNDNCQFVFRDESALVWHRDNGINTIERIIGENRIAAEFLADVYCEWEHADNCKWCYPQNIYEERPIIETSETSVIPTQMIQEYGSGAEDSGKKRNKDEKKEDEDLFQYPKRINLFAKIKDNYKYKNYLYYDHIDRDGHHYQYYIRTGHLFRYIFYHNIENFKKDCKNIRQIIDVLDNARESVNVIVAPRHFSDEMFPQAVNEFVFEKTAHIISLDIRKEYRSNFNTKYSNFAYFLEQIKNKDNIKDKKKINFYFVDDQIISGATFYRAKSLVTSLMYETSSEQTAPPSKYQLPFNVFAGVIVMVNRMSESTKRDYIFNTNKFFSFIDIAIPSIRSYGDSCPICKLNQDAKEYQKKSALSSSAFFWAQKQKRHRIKSLDEARANKREKFIDRHFNRLVVENTLWSGFKKGSIFVKGISEYESKDEILNFFADTVNYNRYNNSAELMISFVKAISRAFIYYRENAKKAALKILISLAEYLINDGGKAIEVDNVIINPIRMDSSYEKYSLLITLINALAAIDSTYLLDVERILKMYNCVLNWQDIAQADVCRFIDNRTEKLEWHAGEEKFEVESFYSVVLNAYKRIICGISGKQKLERFNKMLETFNFDLYRKNKRIETVCLDGATKLGKYELCNLTLLKAMMLESIDECKDDSDLPELTSCCENENMETDSGDKDIVEKYKKIAERLKFATNDCGLKRLTFYYYDSYFSDGLIELNDDAKIVHISEIFGINDNEQIKRLLDTNGFYNSSDNKWIIDLHHYESDCADIKKTQDEEKSMYLFFEFNASQSDADTLFGYIKSVRNVLKYRYWLTSMIDNDIRTDAIKSAIQAKKSEQLIDSDKAVGHGGNADLIQMASVTYNEILKSDNKFDFSQICDMANAMMNMIISYANILSMQDKFFKTKEKPGRPFDVQVVRFDNFKEEEQKLIENLLKAYFREISDAHSIYLQHIVDEYNKTALKNNIKQTVRSIILEFRRNNKKVEVENVAEMYKDIKVLFSVLNIQGKYPYIFFIAIIDLLLRNAVKHGKLDKDGNVYVKFLLSAKGGDFNRGYDLSLVNAKPEKPRRTSKNSLTWQFLTEFLDVNKYYPMAQSVCKIFNNKGKSDEHEFIVTLSCEYVKEHPKNYDEVLLVLNNQNLI